MIDVTQRHDVAIVGASIAGCAAACFLAREGLRIALIERHAGADAYKRICTHYLQPSATPTLQRLGLAEAIDQAGGVRNSVAVWTRWGWIRSMDSPEHPRPYGYNIRRQVLDPMVRRFALETAGVEYFPGETACGLLEEGGRVAGVELESPAGRKRTIRARLVVGADRRDSRVARLAGLSPTVRPHNRFAYFAHFTDVPLPDRGRSRMWLLEPDVVYMFPNDAGVTVLACMPHKRRLAEFKRDLEGSFARSFATLPDGPELGQARRVSPIMGMLEMPNLSRRAARPGLALVGDAALAAIRSGASAAGGRCRAPSGCRTARWMPSGPAIRLASIARWSATRGHTDRS